MHLPDDAPVVVEAAGGLRAVGSVLSCEDFQILLLLDRDLNDKVSSAYLMVEPWKLLEALDKKMNSLNPNINKLAIKIMEEGPDLSTDKDIANVPKGQPAVEHKLETDDIVTVWGPPGTGKTYTMAKIANSYIAQGKSVLIVIKTMSYSSNMPFVSLSFAMPMPTLPRYTTASLLSFSNARMDGSKSKYAFGDTLVLSHATFFCGMCLTVIMFTSEERASSIIARLRFIRCSISLSSVCFCNIIFFCFFSISCVV